MAALEPDLVLASLSVPGMEKVVAGLENAGLLLLTLDPLSLDDIWADMLTVGEATGTQKRARQAVAALQGELEGIGAASKQALAHWPWPPRVLVEWWAGPIIAATRDSWVTPLMQTIGAENALAQREGRSSPLLPEEVRAAQPDLITCSWCGAKKLRPEVIEARGLGAPVAAVPESGLGRPGPRLLEGARAVAEALATLPAPKS